MSNVCPAVVFVVPFVLFLTSFTCYLHLLIRKYNFRVEDIMVRDVRYITLNSSYRELQEMLLTGQLKTLALVESRGKCVLQYVMLCGADSHSV